MKTRKFLWTLLAISLLAFQQASAQSESLETIEFKTDQDYVKYESTFVEAAKWLENTDLDKEPETRKKTNAFVLKYLSGSPSISIELNATLIKLSEGNSQLMFIYMAGFGKSAIENNKDASKKKAFVKAGITSMLNVYKKGIAITKNSELNKLLKMDDAKLEKYIAKNF